MEWISVEDQLPKAKEKVLAFDTQRIYIAYMPEEDEYNEHWVICEENCTCNGVTSAITHWMALPEPPEDKDSAVYFMTKMTQEEFDERTKGHKIGKLHED